MHLLPLSDMKCTAGNVTVMTIEFNTELKTVHLESIQTPSHFPHFVTLQSYFFLINLHTIPDNDKAKTALEKCLKMHYK